MNFYEILGVDTDTDPTEVRRAYREFARRYHPDVNDHPDAGDQFRVLTRARDVLADPEERVAYERLGHADYVEEQIDGAFPTPEMTPRPTEASGGSAAPESDRYSGGASDDAGADDSSTDEGGRASPPGDTASPSDGDHFTVAHSIPPTPGGTRGSTRSVPTGPRRISGQPTQVAQGDGSIRETVVAHLSASVRWLGVVAAAGAYFGGLAGYLGPHRGAVGALAAALTSPDPIVVAAALRGERFGVPAVTAFVGDHGLVGGGIPSDAALLLAGVVLLPLAQALALVELRRATTWRPTWLYVVGALGPAGGVALSLVVSHAPASVPVASVPLLGDLLLLVVFPGIVVGSFLLNRLLVVLPLRRREHLVAP